MFFSRRDPDENADELRRQKVILYQKVFGTSDGKEVLCDLMSRNFVIMDHKGDPHSEGRRAAILDIMHLCSIDVGKLDNLLKGE